jgi:hypothetical protein
MKVPDFKANNMYVFLLKYLVFFLLAIDITFRIALIITHDSSGGSELSMSCFLLYQLFIFSFFIIKKYNIKFKNYLFLFFSFPIVLLVNLYFTLQSGSFFYNYNYIGNYPNSDYSEFDLYYLLFDIFITIYAVVIIFMEQIIEIKYVSIK